MLLACHTLSCFGVEWLALCSGRGQGVLVFDCLDGDEMVSADPTSCLVLSAEIIFSPNQSLRCTVYPYARVNWVLEHVSCTSMVSRCVLVSWCFW